MHVSASSESFCQGDSHSLWHFSRRTAHVDDTFFVMKQAIDKLELFLNQVLYVDLLVLVTGKGWKDFKWQSMS